MDPFATNTHTMQRIPLYAEKGGIQREPWFPFWFPFCMADTIPLAPWGHLFPAMA